MKYIKQFAIIIAISFVGEVLAKVLPFTIPASVYGLFLMLLALVTKVIRVEQVREVSDFLLDVMPIMFVPASVGIMVSWGLLKDIMVPALIVGVLGTLIVMIVSGKTVDGIMWIAGRSTVMSDGITVDGVDIQEGNYQETRDAKVLPGGDYVENKEQEDLGDE